VLPEKLKSAPGGAAPDHKEEAGWGGHPIAADSVFEQSFEILAPVSLLSGKVVTALPFGIVFVSASPPMKQLLGQSRSATLRLPLVA
jgi:hypothetical protein